MPLAEPESITGLILAGGKTGSAGGTDPNLVGRGRAIHRWLAQVAAVPVDFDDGAAFDRLNLNTALTAGGL